jgi:multisubunit Na+/H+ antiporter MnhC subunit
MNHWEICKIIKFQTDPLPEILELVEIIIELAAKMPILTIFNKIYSNSKDVTVS